VLPPPIGWWDVETAGGPPSDVSLETTWRWEARGPLAFRDFANNDANMLVELAIHRIPLPKSSGGGVAFDLYTGHKVFGAPTMKLFGRYEMPQQAKKSQYEDSPEPAMRAAYHVWVYDKAQLGPPDERDKWAAWGDAVHGSDPAKRWPWMMPVWPPPTPHELAREFGLAS
jgi:hypothetical protein